MTRTSWLSLAAACLLLSTKALAQPPSGYVTPVQTPGEGLSAGEIPSVLEGSAFASADAADDEEDPLVTDRPDFTEASSTVGAGRVQLESGYTFTHDNDRATRTSEHAFPEFLLRIGLSDEVELRIGWLGFIFARELDRASGSKDTADGGADMDLGFKFELWEQQGWVPETAVITAITLPTGGDAFSADHVQAIANFLYSWEVTDCFSLGGSTGVAALHQDVTKELAVGGTGGIVTLHRTGDGFVQMSQSVTAGFSLTERLGSYVEWFGFFRTDAADNGPEHYGNGGFTYLINPNFQVDWRAGFGLNERSANFFTGAGFAVRY
jgi:hypothetical protein